METTFTIETVAIATESTVADTAAIVELTSLELSLVGGGTANVAFM